MTDVERDRSSRRALMEASLKLLQRDGVLAGLNLSEVAKEVGVTPANVYHFFGSRRGLLRSALLQALDAFEPEVRAGRTKAWPERPQHMFRLVREHPDLRLLALLALDGDPEGPTMPFLEDARLALQRDVADEKLDAEGDPEIAHTMVLATTIGYAIFRELLAKRLDLPLDEFDDRAERAFERMCEAFVPPR